MLKLDLTVYSPQAVQPDPAAIDCAELPVLPAGMSATTAAGLTAGLSARSGSRQQHFLPEQAISSFTS
jgi:hypothetical protein